MTSRDVCAGAAAGLSLAEIFQSMAVFAVFFIFAIAVFAVFFIFAIAAFGLIPARCTPVIKWTQLKRDLAFPTKGVEKHSCRYCSAS